MVNTTTITAGIVRYRLRALWYPNVTHSPPPSPDCPQLVPGDRKVDTHFHSNFTLPGAALRLAAGHYADVTSPDLDSSEVLSWVMQLRGGGSGDVMEFTMRSGGTLEVRLGECSLPSNMAIVGTVSKAPMGNL